MNQREWLDHLTRELPGWNVWYSSLKPHWSAVPAPEGTSLSEALTMPGLVSAHYPQLLLGLCSERYGWDDYCSTCGVLARECGHRKDEAK